MRAVVQRVESAEVHIDGYLHSQIGKGVLILLGITHEDDSEDVEWLAKKIAQLRIFPDEAGVMNLPLTDTRGEAMVVSQFTLYALTKKGNRPSYIRAAAPEHAVPLYEFFLSRMAIELGNNVKSGVFGAMMDIHLVNQGPVTILIDTKNKE